VKQALADAKRKRNEAQQHEQQEIERAEREIAKRMLTLLDSAYLPGKILETRCWFDWAPVRRAVTQTQFWDACYLRAEAALTDCLKDGVPSTVPHRSKKRKIR